MGQRNESVVFERLMEQGAVKRVGSGRPRRCALTEWQATRATLDGVFAPTCTGEALGQSFLGLTVEPRRGTRFDRQAYRQRNRIERLFNRLKQFRRIATRYEKRADNYLAMLTIGCCSPVALRS